MNGLGAIHLNNHRSWGRRGDCGPVLGPEGRQPSSASCRGLARCPSTDRCAGSLSPGIGWARGRKEQWPMIDLNCPEALAPDHGTQAVGSGSGAAAPQSGRDSRPSLAPASFIHACLGPALPFTLLFIRLKIRCCLFQDVKKTKRAAWAASTAGP